MRGGHYGHYWIKRSQSNVTLWWPVDNPPSIENTEDDVYFGVHPSTTERSTLQRTREIDIEAVNCLFAEFDLKDYGTRKKIRNHIRMLSPKPTIVISSGGGYHCYWLLKTTVFLTDEETRTGVKDLQTQWNRSVGGDKAVHDLARVLRVPGTFNHKPEYGTPRPVEIIFEDSSRLYNLSDFKIKDKSLLKHGSKEFWIQLESGNWNLKWKPRGEDDAGEYPSQSEADLAFCNHILKEYNGNRDLAEERFRASGLYRDDFKMMKSMAPAYRDFTPRPSWKVMTLADAYAPSEPVEYLVDGIIRQPSLFLLYGAGGTLKTMLMIDLGIHIASGKPWLPPSPIEVGTTVINLSQVGPEARPVLQTPVLWIDFDTGRVRTKERVRAFARGLDLLESIPFYYVSMPEPWLNADNPKEIEDLIDLVRELETKFIGVDCLSGVKGRANENTDEIGDVIRAFRRVVEETGATVGIIHHSGKGNRGARGFSGVEQAVDLSLSLERNEETDVITLESTKARDLSIVPFSAEFLFTHKSETSGELESAWFESRPHEGKTNVTGTKKRQTDDKVRKAFIERIEKVPGKDSQEDLINFVLGVVEGSTSHQSRNILIDLEKTGRLKVLRQGRVKSFFLLKD